MKDLQQEEIEFVWNIAIHWAEIPLQRNFFLQMQF